MKPRIAVSLSFEAPDPNRHLFKGKPLQYIEQEMVLSVFEAEGIPLLVPFWGPNLSVKFSEVLEGFHGLLLTGGVDISPESYGEKPLHEDWEGDIERDRYEIGLIREAIRLGLPILGVCRGCQLINVALEGDLYQDLDTDIPQGLKHRDQEVYDQLLHPIELESRSLLGELGGLGGGSSVEVNSIHHQAIKNVGVGLRVVARAPDGVVEAVEVDRGFLLGVQWHPEWLPQEHPLGRKVFKSFIKACSP
jgi:putative glutamine amidotransferase